MVHTVSGRPYEPSQTLRRGHDAYGSLHKDTDDGEYTSQHVGTGLGLLHPEVLHDAVVKEVCRRAVVYRGRVKVKRLVAGFGHTLSVPRPVSLPLGVGVGVGRVTFTGHRPLRVV